ncbi:MAG: acetyl-CoA carboxylase, biotin carboxyl carrier protein [Lachnospiraceae bacterium]|nr:acetyl-CoA carboxylase, biotin carboxyl carrier protein [Lachnospiraceae bacterium]
MSENQWTDNVNFYAEVFERLSLTELSVEDGERKLTLKKELPPMAPPPGMPFPGMGPGMPFSPGQDPHSGMADGGMTAGANASEKSGIPAVEAGFDKVKAPLLGMFHAASSPDAIPYVKVGDRVNKGDTLCIIEAMKMMNDIPAPRDGVIEKICVNENEIVEYGQTLFLIS